MTIATGQLNAAAAQKQTARDEANEATIRQNMPRVLEMLQERIAELEAANAALRAELNERIQNPCGWGVNIKITGCKRTLPADEVTE